MKKLECIGISLERRSINWRTLFKWFSEWFGYGVSLFILYRYMRYFLPWWVLVIFAAMGFVNLVWPFFRKEES